MQRDPCSTCHELKKGEWVKICTIGTQPSSEIPSIYVERVKIEEVGDVCNWAQGWTFQEMCGFFVLVKEIESQPGFYGTVFRSNEAWKVMNEFRKEHYMKLGCELNQVKQDNIAKSLHELKFFCSRCLNRCGICREKYPDLELARVARLVHPLNPNPPYVTCCSICEGIVCKTCEQESCFNGMCLSCIPKYVRTSYFRQLVDILNDLSLPTVLHPIVGAYMESLDMIL